MGGKSKIASRLAALLPDHKCYFEVFAGAANLLFAKDRSKVEVINDINADLVTLFRVVRFHPREFISELALISHSRVEFADFRNQPGLTDIQKAARSFFIIKTAFGGKGGTSHPDFGYGTTGKARYRRTAFAAVTRCHKRLDGVFIENLDYTDCIRRYDRPHTVFFCDPPYLDTGGYKAKFARANHRDLAELLAMIKGKFLLTVNDCKEIRTLYEGFSVKRVPVKYSVSREKTSKARDRTELIIANYPLPKRII